MMFRVPARFYSPTPATGANFSSQPSPSFTAATASQRLFEKALEAAGRLGNACSPHVTMAIGYSQGAAERAKTHVPVRVPEEKTMLEFGLELNPEVSLEQSARMTPGDIKTILAHVPIALKRNKDASPVLNVAFELVKQLSGAEKQDALFQIAVMQLRAGMMHCAIDTISQAQPQNYGQAFEQAGKEISAMQESQMQPLFKMLAGEANSLREQPEKHVLALAALGSIIAWAKPPSEALRGLNMGLTLL